MEKTKFEDIGKITREIAKIKNVKAIYLFGSYAQTKQHALSDIDICVIGDLTEEEEIRVYGKGSDNLDLAIFNRIPLAIKFRVLKDGKPLIVKDEKYIQKVKFYTLRDYLDFKPAINKFIMEKLKCTI
jgi:predicted nucleotidyltransferase